MHNILNSQITTKNKKEFPQFRENISLNEMVRPLPTIPTHEKGPFLTSINTMQL